MWLSELLPHTAKMVDDLCFIRTMQTDAINHEPAITLMQTGNQITGRPCLGAWVSYGLGSLNENLPTFVVLVARPTNTEQVQAISARLWSAGYLPGEHAGVSFRTSGDPILFINNPPGVSPEVRRRTLDGAEGASTKSILPASAIPETRTRQQQYELAFRMQGSMPELADHRPRAGCDVRPLRRGGAEAGHVRQCGPAGPAAGGTRRALRADLSQQLGHACQRGRSLAEPMPGRRPGLLGTGSGFETARAAGRNAGDLGGRVRPHDLLAGRLEPAKLRPRPPSPLLHHVDGRRRIAGGAVHGETDDFCYNVVKDPVPVRDFHATVLHLLGFDHERFTFRYQGLDQRLTGVEAAHVVKDLLA